MKTRKITNRLIGMLCIAGLLIGCSEEEGLIGPEGPMGEQGVAGPQGPAGEDGQDGEALGVPGPQGNQGEQGPQGDQGPAGPAGEDGQDGATGTANVIYSDWIASDFPTSINSDFDQWEMFAPELTQEIHDTGVILVYARKGTLIYQLPDSYYTSINEHWNFRLLDINDTLIAIRVHSIGGGNIGEPFLNGDFRYILIPGGVAASGKSSIDFSEMSYYEVIEYFDIPE